MPEFENKVQTPSLQIGTSATAGQVLTADASGNATYQALSKTYRTVHTFGIKGVLTAADSTPSFFFSKTVAQTSNLVKVRYKIASGTNATFKIQRNGADITGYGTTAAPLTVTTTAAETTSTVALADNDEIDLVLIGVIASPTDLAVTLVVEHAI